MVIYYPLLGTSARYCGIGLNCKSTDFTCAPGALCLNPNGFCVHINTGDSLFSLPGRKDEGSLCIAANTSPAIYCSKNYCLIVDRC